MSNKLLKIVNHFGIKNQSRKFNEECFELIEAIIQSEYPGVLKDKKPEELIKLEKEHITEEIADCMVLLNQFIEYYDISMYNIKKLFEKKVNRTIKRIEDGYYETHK